MTFRDAFALIVLGAIWGGSFIFMRVAAPEFGIYPLVELRTLLASCVLAPVLLWRGGLRQVGQYWFPIMLLGAVNTAIPFALFNYSSLHLDAGVIAILNATAPMFGALVALLWLGDKLSLSASVGLAFGFAGVTLISYQTMGNGHLSLVPVLGVLGATLCYGTGACMMKKWLHGVQPLAVAAGSQAFASMLLLPFALTTLPEVMPSSAAWANAIALAAGGTGIAYLIYFQLIANIGPSRAMTVAYLVPLFGIIWGLVFLGEKLSATSLLGGAFILSGVAMTTGMLKYFRRRSLASQ